MLIVCGVRRAAYAVALALSVVAGGAGAVPEVVSVLGERPGARYDEQVVIRVRPGTEARLQQALGLADAVWSERVAPTQTDMMLDARRLGELDLLGLDFEILIPSVQDLLDAEWASIQDAARAKARADAQKAPARPGTRDITFFQNFQQLSAIHTYINDLAVARPDLASTFSMGNSLEGRPLRAITITGPDTPSSPRATRPVVMWIGCQHAREWISPMVVTYLADQLIAQYDTNPDVRDLVDSVEFVILPVTNPDGYVYSWSTQRLWRKNRRGGYGVDLNRNWAYEWGGLGASTSTSSDTYRGSGPFSEPETSLVAAYATTLGTRLKSFIDYHSYSQLILWPFGYDFVQAPEPDRTFFVTVTDQMADQILLAGGVPYVAQHSADLYPASGDAVDWFYGEQNAKSLTIELRDEGTFGFVLPASQIVPTCVENWPAALLFAEASVRPLIATPVSIPTVVNAGQTAAASISFTAAAEQLLAGSVRAYTRVGTSGDFVQQIPSASQGGTVFTATLPAVECGENVQFYFTAQTTIGSVISAPAPGASGPYAAEGVQIDLAFLDTMETTGLWSVAVPSDTATSGRWERANPVGTTAQPENDFTATGTLCYVTGASATSLGSNDVDGGTTTLTSPALDALDGDGDAWVRYHRWYSNDQGAAPNADSMPVQISADNGVTWVEVENVTENAGAWVAREFRVADYVTPSAQVRVRFIAQDLDSGSIVEAAVDDVSLEFRGCPDDANPIDLTGDGVVDSGDLALFVSLFVAGDLAVDFTGDGVVDSGDLGEFIVQFLAAVG
jgi:hypothetical protein